MKRFVASDMKEAMEKIREDLGADAVILDSNPIRSKGIGGLFKQEVEVVAAYEPSASPKPVKPAPPAKTMDKPLHVVHPAAARYAAVMQQDNKASSSPVPQKHTTLEPVAFPFLDSRAAGGEPARKPEPVRTVMPQSSVVSQPVCDIPQINIPETAGLPAQEAANKTVFVEYQKDSDPLSDQIASLKDAVHDFSQRISLMTKDTALGLPPDILNLYSGLIDRDVPETLAKELAVQTQMAQSRRSVKAQTAAAQIILDKLGEPMPMRIKAYQQNVLFFVGPTGAGKTTTLVKLAGMLAVEHKLKVGLVNMDTYRVGAMEHMRIYADIMELPLHTAYSADELKGALEALADRDVVLVDTAGKSTGDESYQKEMEKCLQTAQADEVFLVVSVATGHRACREILQNYAFLPDYKLIITKLDEVSAWGNVLHIRELTHKPLSYVTVGQNVPDDIRPADPKKLADNIVGKRVSVL